MARGGEVKQRQPFKDKDKDKIKITIKTVYCHVASTWNLDVVAYIIHTYIHTYIHKYT